MKLDEIDWRPNGDYWLVATLHPSIKVSKSTPKNDLFPSERFVVWRCHNGLKVELMYSGDNPLVFQSVLYELLSKVT